MIIKKDNIKLSTSFPFNIYTNTIYPKFDDDIEDYYHWHDCLEISYILDGSGYFLVNGTKYEMKSGDIIIFNNIEPHSWSAYKNTTMKVNSIVFSPNIIWNSDFNTFDYQYLKPFLERTTNFNNKLPKDNPFTSNIYNLLLMVVEEFKNKPLGYELMIKAKLLETLTYLIRNFQDDTKTFQKLKVKENSLERLNDVVLYLKNNYSEEITLDSAAKVACMNPNYFSGFFKETMGISFVDYLTRIRVKHSEILIKNTNLKFCDIALSCGFTSISNFNRTFKKVNGIIPSEFRNTASPTQLILNK